MAGSLGLNKLFEETVKNLIGSEQFASLKDSVGWSKALNEFDKTIKTGFNGDLADIHYVTFPMAKLEDDHSNGIYGNCWEMTG